MLDRFLRVSVTSPYVIHAAMTEALSLAEKQLSNYRGTSARRYEAADHRSFRSDPHSYRSAIAVTHLGSLRVAGIVDRRGTISFTEQPGLPAHCLCLTRRGGAELRFNDATEIATSGPHTALMVPGHAGTRITSSDDSARLNIWMPTARLQAAAESLLDRRIAREIVFAPTFDVTRGAGASLVALVAHMERELARSDSLLASHIGTDLFEDLLCRSIVQGLRHNYSEWLERPEPAADLRSVRRAEEYLRAHVEEPIRLTDLARAAKCSVRSLQESFRRTRGTTPMAALRQARLEQARETLAGGQAASVTDVALQFGFANPGRFALLYRAAFGERPLQTLRRHRR